MAVAEAVLKYPPFKIDSANFCAMTKRLYIQTWGCQMNEYDSSKMADVLGESHKIERTDNPEEADVILLNTCSVREKAQEKVFSQLGRWRPLKEKNPDLIIGVGGCVASQEGEAIRERNPDVDIIFGPQTLHRLPEMVKSVEETRKPTMDISFPEIEKFDRLPEPKKDGPTAFVSIMEGCSKYCTFCVVPYTRGEEISRPFDDVIAEIVSLVDQGVVEINLLGQNVNAYRGTMHDGGVADLALLLNYMNEIDGLERIRYTTSHPVEFSDALIQAYAEVPKLVDHLHLPVQAGSDRILAVMKRGHTVAEYEDKIRRLREIRPNISLSSDFIVGYPTETEEEFMETLQLIERIGFDHSFSFVYSARPGTPAALLVDSVPMDVKKRWLHSLQSRISENAIAISNSMVGTTQKVLVERTSRKNEQELAGKTENARWVNFPAPEGLDAYVGKIVDVYIEEAFPNSLRGHLVTV